MGPAPARTSNSVVSLWSGLPSVRAPRVTAGPSNAARSTVRGGPLSTKNGPSMTVGALLVGAPPEVAISPSGFRIRDPGFVSCVLCSVFLRIPFRISRSSGPGDLRRSALLEPLGPGDLRRSALLEALSYDPARPATGEFRMSLCKAFPTPKPLLHTPIAGLFPAPGPKLPPSTQRRTRKWLQNKVKGSRGRWATPLYRQKTVSSPPIGTARA